MRRLSLFSLSILAACTGIPTDPGQQHTLAMTPMLASISPLGQVTFTATGGNGALTFAVETNASGATIDATGLYTAGATGDVTDQVSVTDGTDTVIAAVTVTTALGITADTSVVPPRGGIAFTASGGSGEGYVWSLSASPSGGSIDASGAYVAGSTGSVADVVTLTDSVGASASVQVTVAPGVTVTSDATSVLLLGAATFTAAGGAAGGYTWSLADGGSGATIDGEGHYVAGASAATDTIIATDSIGNSGSLQLSVFAPPAVDTFSATTGVVAPGASVDLAAGFTGGTGLVEPGDLVLVPGVPLTVTPIATTTYTITVTGPTGATATKAITIVVDGFTLVGASWDGSAEQVARIDPETGVATNLGALGDLQSWYSQLELSPDGSHALAYGNGADGSQYIYSLALADGTATALPVSALELTCCTDWRGRLITADWDGTQEVVTAVDPLDGTATRLGTFAGLQSWSGGMSLDDSADMLYAFGYDADNVATFYSLDLKTGDSASYAIDGPLPITAARMVNGYILTARWTGTEEVVEWLDPANGARTAAGVLGDLQSWTGQMTIDVARGLLYTFGNDLNGAQDLYTLDLNTGASTQVVVNGSYAIAR